MLAHIVNELMPIAQASPEQALPLLVNALPAGAGQMTAGARRSDRRHRHGRARSGCAEPDELYKVALSGQIARGMGRRCDGLADPVAVSRAPTPELPGPELRYARRLDRSAQLALAAARQAIAAGSPVDGVDASEVGVIIGSSRGPIARTRESVARRRATRRVSPTASAETTPGSLSGVIAQAIGFGGSTLTHQRDMRVRRHGDQHRRGAAACGRGRAVVVGGAEAPLIALLAAQLTGRACHGLERGSGADLPAVRRRPQRTDDGRGRRGPRPRASIVGRTPRRHALAVLSGWATGSDDGGRTGVTADGEGLVRVMRKALARAGLAPAVDRPRECARHGDAAQRSGRSARAELVLWRGTRSTSQLDEADHRPLPRRDACARGGHRHRVAAQRLPATDGESPATWTPSASSTSSPASRARRARMPCCRRRSASGAFRRRSSSRTA